MTHHTRRSRRTGGRPRVRGLAAIIAALVLALAFAACGSDDEESGSSSSGGTSTGASADASGGVAEAQKRLEPFKAAPTKITLTEPLKSKPPSGKTVVMLGTNDPNNQKLQKGLKELTELVGWNYSTVAYDPANPATLNAGDQHRALEEPRLRRRGRHPAHAAHDREGQGAPARSGC